MKFIKNRLINQFINNSNHTINNDNITTYLFKYYIFTDHVLALFIPLLLKYTESCLNQSIYVIYHTIPVYLLSRNNKNPTLETKIQTHSLPVAFIQYSLQPYLNITIASNYLNSTFVPITILIYNCISFFTEFDLIGDTN